MNDKCVWIVGQCEDDDSEVYAKSCGGYATIKAKFWKFCPYCGKKIETKENQP